MLFHISADGKSAVALSFPRDLRVRIPGYSGYNKINAAYTFGGPNLIIKTIQQLTGLPVNHYVEVNFASFRGIVNAVGGLRICVSKGVYDRRSGLYIPKPGCYNFDGDRALAFARMRYADPKGDFGRIERQQLLVRTLMTKVTSLGFLVNVKRLINVISAVSGGVITDQRLGIGEIRGIARRLAGFKQSNVDFRVLPSYAKYIGDTSWVIAKDEAGVIYERLLKDEPLPEGSEYGKTSQSIPGPADVSITVLNGTDKAGLARTVASKLRGLGYVVNKVADYTKHDVKTTQISFAPGLTLKAQLVQREFPGATVQESVDVKGADVVVVLGADQISPSPGS
jgi:LCP family protein required for cell wall assembly